MQPFQWDCPTRLVFGCGHFQRAGELASQLGRCALLLTTRSSAQRLGYLAEVTSQLGRSGIAVEVFPDLSHGPTARQIDHAAQIARTTGADFLIALGGGSVMDAAKAVAAVTGSEHPTVDFLYARVHASPDALPVMAIPTLAGSGSEVNKSAMVTDDEKPFKDGIRSPFLFPRIALVDPELMRPVPRAVTAHTGFDILAHAIESYVSPKANPLSDRLATDVMPRVIHWLPRVLDDLDNLEARENLAFASTLMGFNLGNVGTCLPHRLDKALCAIRPEIAHGKSVAMFYPVWAKTAWSGAVDRFAEITRLLSQETLADRLPDALVAPGFGETIDRFRQQVEVTDSLSDVGLSPQELIALQERVAGDLSINPVPVSREQLPDLLQMALQTAPTGEAE